jgi:hypothetical protein
MIQPAAPVPADRDPRRPDARYVALLTGAAWLILVVGAVLRPEEKPVAVVPANELATLPDRSRRRALRDITDYIGERAGLMARSVAYLAAVGASGVVVGPDSVLSAHGRGATPGFLLLDGVGGDSVEPAPRALGGDTLSIARV